MTATDPTAPATPGEALDVTAVETRAEHYRRLCHQTGNSHAPDVVQAAHACADDVPALLDELRRVRGEAPAAPALSTSGSVVEHKATAYWDGRSGSYGWKCSCGHRIRPVFPALPEADAAARSHELDAARATNPAPATPPEHQPGAHIINAAIAYVDAPEDSPECEQRYDELEEAVMRYRAEVPLSSTPLPERDDGATHDEMARWWDATADHRASLTDWRPDAG